MTEIEALIQHVGCGSVDEFGACKKCDQIRDLLAAHTQQPLTKEWLEGYAAGRSATKIAHTRQQERLRDTVEKLQSEHTKRCVWWQTHEDELCDCGRGTTEVLVNWLAALLAEEDRAMNGTEALIQRLREIAKFQRAAVDAAEIHKAAGLLAALRALVYGPEFTEARKLRRRLVGEDYEVLQRLLEAITALFAEKENDAEN